jgi:predicted 3-demethylubiquinone-9 3-methyltransferase (glyoxalase superfamily)
VERDRRQWRLGKPAWLVQGQVGVSWQITPRALFAALADHNRSAAERAFDAMMTMEKFDIATIEAARRG